MLHKYYKFVIVNNSGQTVTHGAGTGDLLLRVTGVYVVPSTGLLAYDIFTPDECGFDATDTWANGAEVESSEIDNATNKYINALVKIEVEHTLAATAEGSFDIYYTGGDATGALETDADGYNSAESMKLTFIGSLTWPTGVTNNESLLSPTFTI
jgi:hypothetical protein